MKNTLKYLISVLIFTAGSSFCLQAGDFSNQTKENSRIKLVVIDPGHGGIDEGAVYGNYREKDIVLDIALKLGNYITSRFPETKVIYTRTKDVFVPLHQRATIANKNKADLFISIHINYVESKSVQGTETFVLGYHRSKDNLEVAKKENAVILLEDDYSTIYEGFDPNSPESYIMFELVQDEYLEQSVLLASAIQNEFREKANRKDRSVKQAGFLVLRQTTMPGVLVEAGFISNSVERNYMISEAGKISLATAIFNAFREYKEKVEKRNSFHLVAEKPRIEVESLSEDKLEKKYLLNGPVAINQEKIFFSVQVAALANQIETNSENFFGEKEIFKLNSDNIYRYFSGKFAEYDKAVEEKRRLQPKFGGAFVVAIEDGKLISVKKAMRKM
jgi:N-acetylmuramoyl-L-alanine amidase